LALGLAERDEVCQVSVIIGVWQTPYFASSFGLTSSKIKLIEVDIKNSSSVRNRWFLTGLPQMANHLRPDVVHLSFPLPILRRWFNAPVVATIHDLYPYEYPQNFGYPQVWFNQGFLNWCVNQVDGLSCVSKTTLAALETYFPKLAPQKPLEVIYNSVEIAPDEPTLPTAFQGNYSQPFILGVAQHRKNKNLDLLVRAYAALLQDHSIEPGTRLILVGSTGPETAALHQLVSTLELTESVNFLSGLSDNELSWLYQQAALFVMPSSTEGFCLPLVEAQAAGCPVVCSDIPIFREIAGPQCWYFSLDSQALPNLINAVRKTLASNQPRQRFINPLFSRATTTQQYLTFYHKLISYSS
jgi:glycosyltransferase involved in cell wall biosynthesis